jgi:hypothetical protein
MLKYKSKLNLDTRYYLEEIHWNTEDGGDHGGDHTFV